MIDISILAAKNILSSLSSTLQYVISNNNRLHKIQSYIANLQQLYEPHNQSLNLRGLFDDLLLIIRRVLTKIDICNWQSAIDGCIIRQCPWFKPSSLLCNNKNLNHASSIMNRYRLPAPSTDHTYALTNEHNLHDRSADLLLDCLDKNFNNGKNRFNNLHKIDTRKCQICETLSDHVSSNIGRLISFGMDQWVHVGCILPAYAKNLDQPPYILRNIRETVLRCQTKYICAICSELGASVHCYENECYQRFHCECIRKYYSTIDKSIQEQLNIKNGFLPNLTTLCLKHNGLKAKSNLHRISVDESNEDELKESLNNRMYSYLKILLTYDYL